MADGLFMCQDLVRDRCGLTKEVGTGVHGGTETG